ncbi:hypothetical protein [Spiroplasma floricola]|uniref:Uncharacterized protein n=1 Tax=Spiroplasma floricola 23-6 TaxID=1336749 RepID=A0A2K8SEG5_9MOLU|nr:hypothetical protein [Spiroplasma floricola]AUB31648.1 hypothetical protein SFLOR_v1c05960 [Spiroplasma floricola 23-6]
MKKTKNYETYIKLFIAGLFIITIFDTAIVLSISIRGIIYLFEDKWFIILIQILPLIFFVTLLTFELKLLIKYFKKLRSFNNEEIKERHMLTFDYIVTENKNHFKKEMIFVYISCSFIVLFGGIGVIPLVFLINGQKSHKKWLQEK